MSKGKFNSSGVRSSDVRGKDPATQANAMANYNIFLKKSAARDAHGYRNYDRMGKIADRVAAILKVDPDLVNVDSESGSIGAGIEGDLSGAARAKIAKIPGISKVHVDILDMKTGRILTKDQVKKLESSIASQGKPVGKVGSRKASIKTGRSGGAGDQPRVPAGDPDGGQWTKA